MDVSMTMGAGETYQLRTQLDTFNRSLNDGREVKQTLDRDDFLKILLTQLTNQDPTAPMEDKEFIAQMAQFSTLEQMTGLTNEFRAVGDVLASGRALQMLGRTVDIVAGDAVITGTVDEVTAGDFPQLLVDGQYYDADMVGRVR